MQLIKTYVPLLLAIVLNFHVAFAQTLPSCPCSGSLCVTTAQQLFNLLNPLNNPPIVNPNDVITICGTINLGDLVPNGQPIPFDLFPLIVPPFVKLQGNYDFFNYNQGGTTINFPFLFAVGKKCDTQGPSDLPPEGGEPDDPEALAALNNSNNSLAPSTSATDDVVYVFKLMEGAQLKNLCIAGPKTDTKEQDMIDNIEKTDDCNGNPLPALPLELLAVQGVCKGVLMEGKNSLIKNCEIYGFPMMGVEVVPATTPPDHGTVYIDRCYIHNNKGWGYGYGAWLSGGSGGMYCDDNVNALCTAYDKTTNSWIPAPLQNSPYEDQVLNLTNTFFFENGKDLDATNNRNTLFIDHCTFSERTPAGSNINRHTGQFVCNDYQLPATPGTLPCSANPAPFLPSNPYPNKTEACNITLKEVGGNRTWIENSFFYKGQNNLTLSYPNTFDPTLGTGVLCTSPIGFTLTTSPLIHIGSNPGAPPPDDRKYNYFINKRTNKWGRIIIAKTDNNDWDINDPHIEIRYPTNNIPTTDSDGRNYYVADETNAPVPMLGFDYSDNKGAFNPNLIIQGTLLDFYTFNCRDAAFKCCSDMLYMWRFHEKPYDHVDEIRTNSMNGWPLSHKFNKIGITNVNLMAIDVNNNFAASTIATQQITIAPPANNGHVVMVVNIKDTYDGRHLTGDFPCRYDRVDLCMGDAMQLEPCNYIDQTRTGFEKFIKINGVDKWVQDIAIDNGGWQRIELNIENDICTDNPPSSGCLVDDEIEIGIRTTSQGVDATLVRGVSLYVDDVYIQSVNGYNALANGDFEEYKSGTTTQPEAWQVYTNGYSYTYPCNGNPAIVGINNKNNELSRDEVRSGHTSFSGRILPVFADWLRPFIPGMRYFGPQVFKSVKQTFNFQAPPPPRLADTTEVMPSPGFTLLSNPAKYNTAINAFITNLRLNETYNIKITSPNGAVVYNNTAKEYEFTFNASYPPGVYFVNIQSKSYSGFKKLVVAN